MKAHRGATCGEDDHPVELRRAGGEVDFSERRYGIVGQDSAD
jgi:hypothetical protein